MTYHILQKRHFLNIPSGSGIEVKDGHIYIVGDDSCFLYKLAQNWALVEKIALFETPNPATERIAKPEKPDLEAMTLWEENGENCLLLIGSGSKSPQRDTAYKVFSPPKVQKISFTALYDKLRKSPLIPELNIEAAIQWQSYLVLFQRGGIFQENAAVLVQENEPEILPFSLPLINNVQAGISGAVYWAEKDLLLFCASAEATANSYDDGEICGSLIGQIPDFSAKMKKKELFTKDCVILGEIPKQKIESITIAKVISSTEIILLAVADNDDGTSFLFEIGVTL